MKPVRRSSVRKFLVVLSVVGAVVGGSSVTASSAAPGPTPAADDVGTASYTFLNFNFNLCGNKCHSGGLGVADFVVSNPVTLIAALNTSVSWSWKTWLVPRERSCTRVPRGSPARAASRPR